MRQLAACALALMAGVALTACNGSEESTPAKTDTAPADTAPAGPLERIVYASSNWYGHAPTWVGIEQGIFERAGFAVEATPFGSSPNRLAALQADTAQFASLGEVALLMAMANDQQGFYWIGNQDIAPGCEGLVGIGIDKIGDLRGKTIAVNLRSSVHITCAQLLEAHGIDMNDPAQVTIKHATDSDVVNLVRSGEAQAGIIWEPFYSDLQDLADAKVLGTDLDTTIYKQFKTMTGPDVICCSKQWFDADPARAKRLFRAYWEAVAWCKAHPDELIDLIAKQVGKDRASVEPVMSRFQWLTWDEQPVVMSDAMLFGQAQVAAEVLFHFDAIPKVPDYRAWARLDVFDE